MQRSVQRFPTEHREVSVYNNSYRLNRQLSSLTNLLSAKPLPILKYYEPVAIDAAHKWIFKQRKTFPENESSPKKHISARNTKTPSSKSNQIQQKDQFFRVLPYLPGRKIVVPLAVEQSSQRNSQSQVAVSVTNNSTPFIKYRSETKPKEEDSTIKIPTAVKSTKHAKQFKPQMPPIDITAQSWIVIDGKSGNTLAGKSEYKIRQMASLTKLMTLYIAAQVLQEYNVDVMTTTVTVSPYAAMTGGATAALEEGDMLILRDLFFASALPSGNDAANTLAEFVGDILLKERQDNYSYRSGAGKVPQASCNRVTRFIQEMNLCARRHGFQRTTYYNAHGLNENKSCAFEQAQLMRLCLEMPLLRQVMSQRDYQALALSKNGAKVRFEWKHIDRLVSMGWSASKSGWTPQAGPSICASYQEEDDESSYVLCCLRLAEKDSRWVDPPTLLEWVAKTSCGKTLELEKRFAPNSVWAQRFIEPDL